MAETVDVTIAGSPERPVLVEIDAEAMAQIIYHHTHARGALCIRAANALCDYLAQVHRKAQAEHSN